MKKGKIALIHLLEACAHRQLPDFEFKKPLLLTCMCLRCGHQNFNGIGAEKITKDYENPCQLFMEFS